MTVVAAEVSLRLAPGFLPARYTQSVSRTARAISDSRLGWRPNPLFMEHDEHGFRNPKGMIKADVVAQGDSQTYGAGVSPDEAWPRQLAHLTGRPTYSLAYGGWGPTHSLLLLDEALALSPRVILEAFYSGNDLYDAYSHVYMQGQLHWLMSKDQRVIQAIAAAERNAPLAKSVQRLYFEQEDDGVRAVKDWLATNSRLYLLAGGTVRFVRERHGTTPDRTITQPSEAQWAALKAEAAGRRHFQQVFEQERFRTIFTPSYRAVAVNTDDPRIREGLRLCLEALRELRDKAAAQRVQLFVLLIPTKELVFKGLAYQPTTRDAYENAVDREELVWQTMLGFLKRQAIPTVDALPVLRARLLEGVQPYPAGSDGHLNAEGHRVIAQAVARAGLIGEYEVRGHARSRPQN